MQVSKTLPVRRSALGVDVGGYGRRRKRVGGPWTVAEVDREFGNRNAWDGIGRFAGAGLIHRIEDFAVPTRAARRVRELNEPY